VDFDDLIRLAIDLLENDAEFLERLRYRCPTSSKTKPRIPANSGRYFAPAGRTEGNWVRVGDPNQAIFETFTTANPQHLLDFIQAEADQYKELPDSGRCQPSIIALANQLIKWVNGEHPDPAVRDALTVPYIPSHCHGRPAVESARRPGRRQAHRQEIRPEEEVEAVVKSIARWLPEHMDATVAVLCRATSAAWKSSRRSSAAILISWNCSAAPRPRAPRPDGWAKSSARWQTLSPRPGWRKPTWPGGAAKKRKPTTISSVRSLNC